jgi:hypothetical protein
MVAPSGPPDPATLWDYVKLNAGFLGFLISLVLAFVKGYELWNARLDRSRDQQAKVNDAWFKTIVLDGAIPDIRNFLEGQRSSFKNALSAKTVRPFMSAWQSYQPKSEELMLRLIPVEELSARAYAAIEREFEQLADIISPFCSHADDASYPRPSIDKEWASVQQQMDRCFRESLSALRLVHLNLSRGRHPDTGIAA